ncbi:unnamed protein product [Rhizoctonia solani]|uniref:Uncharacterized protein n=1 Tax=Rhizoctonia solani TaxID=456999 RepID=A0A8H3DQZ8_9AGAM|nr:unnamed protein product [Rhizoctonia solani]
MRVHTLPPPAPENVGSRFLTSASPKRPSQAIPPIRSCVNLPLCAYLARKVYTLEPPKASGKNFSSEPFNAGTE